MSRYIVQPYIRDTEAEDKYTFAEVKYSKIVAIHHHWMPLREFYKFFEANTYLIDITGVTIDGEEPAVGDVITNDQHGENMILHIKNDYTLDEKKKYVIEKLKIMRDQKEQDVIKYNGVMFDADEISQQRMEKARKFLEDNDMPSITWTTAENTRMDIGVQDFKNINTLIAIRSNDLHVRYNQLKTYINTLRDQYFDLLDLIDWDWDIEQNLDERLAQLREEQNNNVEEEDPWYIPDDFVENEEPVVEPEEPSNEQVEPSTPEENNEGEGDNGSINDEA